MASHTALFTPSTASRQHHLKRYFANFRTPYQYSGTPLFADPQSLIFSLYTPVGVALGPHYTPTVFGCLTMLHLAAGGVALIAYARHFQASMLQRVMAALLFATAGVATSRLQHVAQIVTYCYWPVALYVGYLWVTQRRAWHPLALTGVLALIAVNPNQLTLLGAVAIGALLLVHVTQCAASRGWALGGLLLAAGSALAIASPVLAAVLEFSQLSTRTAHTLLDSQASSLPISALSGLFFPGVFGIGGWGRLLWMANDISENWLYLGVGPVFVLLLGLRDRPTHAAVAILLLLVLAAAFVLGVNTPFYPWLYAHVPGFSLFHRPSDGCVRDHFFGVAIAASSALDTVARATPIVDVGCARGGWRCAFCVGFWCGALG